MSGRFFEEFRANQVIAHAATHTVSEMDNVLFSSLTMNPQPLHLDEEFARNSPYGTRIVNGIFTLGLLLGLSVPELTLGTTIAVMEIDKIAFPQPAGCRNRGL